MKERPILFSAPMVRAILEGRKTQTRRIVRPLIREILPRFGCPYGAVGDRLWVRETWAVSHVMDHLKPREVPHGGSMVYYAATENTGGLMKRPSIFMPRWASRVVLEVTAIRAERLQDISEEDAKAEGATFFADIPIGVPHRFQDAPRWSMDTSPPNTDHCLPTARVAFGNLWNRINGDGSWDANPIVWVVAFRPIEKATKP